LGGGKKEDELRTRKGKGKKTDNWKRKIVSFFVGRSKRSRGGGKYKKTHKKVLEFTVGVQVNQKGNPETVKRWIHRRKKSLQKNPSWGGDLYRRKSNVPGGKRGDKWESKKTKPHHSQFTRTFAPEEKSRARAGDQRGEKKSSQEFRGKPCTLQKRKGPPQIFYRGEFGSSNEEEHMYH